MRAFSKVKALLTRWYYSKPEQYDKTMVKSTMYEPYFILQSYQDVRVFDGNELQFTVFRMEDGKTDVFWGRNKDKHQHIVDAWVEQHK